MPAILSAIQNDGGEAYAARVREDDGRLVLSNPGQGFDATIGGDGVSVVPRADDGAASPALGLNVTSVAFDDMEQTLDRTPPRTHGSRVTYGRRGKGGAALDEWYVNGPLGLQQGFTIAAPAAGSARALSIRMSLGAAWRAEVSPDGRRAILADAALAGGERAAFGPLLAWDANGTMLEARMRGKGEHLEYEVATAGAAWPVTIDPVLNFLRLTAPDAQAFDSFGDAVAVSGNTAVVGAPFVVINGIQQGAVYVFVRSGNTWVQQGPRLTAPAALVQQGQDFGDSVAIDGDTLAVGASGDNESVLPRVFVFVRTGGSWALQQALASTSPTLDFFGNSVSLDGNTLAVGAPTADDGGVSGRGAVAVYTRSGSTWSLQQRIVVIDGTQAPFDGFGRSVSVFRNRLVAGAPSARGATINDPDEGAAFVFTRSGAVWTQVARLTNPAGAQFDSFGFNVDLDDIGAGDVIAGAAGFGTNGAAFVFPFNGTTYGAPTTLTSTSFTVIGQSLSLDQRNRALVGSSTAVLVFSSASGVWSLVSTNTFSGSPVSGTTVRSSGSTAVAGSGNETVGSFQFAGAAYVFPPNDARLSATQIPAFLLTGMFEDVADTQNAYFDPADPIPGCNINRAKSVWYSFTGRTDGGSVQLEANRQATGAFNPVLSVWTPGVTGGLVQVACNDNGGADLISSLLTFTPTPGTQYYALVTDAAGSTTGIQPGGGAVQFVYRAAHPLTVTTGGTGSGTVSSVPAGIANCGNGGGDCTEPYNFNTPVTLTSTPGAGSATAWAGCDSVPSANQCVVTITQPRSVTATFTAAPIITTRTPASGSTSGGTLVELTGTGFNAGSTTVSVNSVPLTNVVFTGTTGLRFFMPMAAPGLATISVTNAGGTASVGYTYVAPVRVTQAGSQRPAFSFNGRYTAFESRIALFPGDTNGVSDIYVRDRTTNTIRRVSISSQGSQALGGESTHAAISATGRFVAFQSRATNLVFGDTNRLQDVFLHDRDADNDGVFDEPGAISTIRVSVGPGGAQALGGHSGDASISGNGRWVTFESAAANLTGASDTLGFIDVFVFDRLLGQTSLISTPNGGSLGNGHSLNPAISLNGRVITYQSRASNIVAGDTNGFSDIFVRDRDTDNDGVMDESVAIATFRVSVDSRGAQALNGDSVQPSTTQEGRWVVFASTADNLVAGDTNLESDVFIHDRSTLQTRRLSVGPNGAQFVGPSRNPVISANGALLLFLTSGLNAPASGGVSEALSIHDADDDGKSTSGVIPGPTEPSPPPPTVEPPPPTGNAEDPAVSGDGSQTGNTVQPNPGTGNGAPSTTTESSPPTAEAPFISGLEPSQGPTGGGNLVEIQGGNFQGATVQWNGAPLAIVSNTGSTIRVNAPASGGLSFQTVRVLAGGQASNVRTYAYVAGLSAPVITSFSPSSGPTGGGPPVTIIGTGFSAPSVRFGPLAGSVTAPTATSITVTPPPGTAGSVPVVVTNGDGSVAVSNDPYIYFMGAPSTAPSVTDVQPTSGPVTGGTALTISGAQFGPGTTVTVGGVAASDVQVLSNTELIAVTPPGPEGPATVTVTVPGQAPATRAFVYDPVTAPILTCNPANGDADTDAVADAWEDQFGLSSADPADGALDQDGDGRTSAQECADSTHPRAIYTRYLAEGATGTFFTTRVAVANPGSSPARVLFRFLTGEGAVVRRFLTVPATTRRTLDLQLFSGLESANISTVVESDTEIVVDRTMRWDTVVRGGAHAEASVPTASLQWYLAEGATHGSFDLFYLIQNPSLTTPANVQIRFLLPAGAPLVRSYVVPANTRFTLPVDQIPELAETDVSAVVESMNLVPIIVERAMYSSAAGIFAAGHDSAGVTSPSLQWFFAEGATGSFFDLFLLFANPGAADAAIQATYLLPSGATVVKSYTVNANSRRTVNVAFEDPALADTAVSVAIQSTNGVPIIAERAMWWPHGQPWHEAHNSAGSTVTGTKWAVADGEQGTGDEATQTYILVANTSGSAATLRVTVLLESGAPLVREYTVNANSRFNVPVGTEFNLPPGTRFGAVVESLGGAPIVVERAMYWNAAGVIWAAGSNVLATKLQ